jgi:hypothetical protein
MISDDTAIISRLPERLRFITHKGGADQGGRGAAGAGVAACLVGFYRDAH